MKKDKQYIKRHTLWQKTMKLSIVASKNKLESLIKDVNIVKQQIAAEKKYLEALLEDERFSINEFKKYLKAS